MWLPDKNRLIKVRLQDQGLDVETPWAEDLGPAPVEGARRARLANVPFLHAKPTYEDVIVVVPDEQGILTWDRNGVSWEQIRTRIDDDSGRWAMIVDYAPGAAADTLALFSALDIAAAQIDVCFEGCFGPHNGEPGRAYLAVPAAMVSTARKRALPLIMCV
jgi:hypothetical protein